MQTESAARSVPLLSLGSAFFRLGATTFGGMWAATDQLEEELVRRRGWLRSEDLPFLLVTANLIPAPRFIGLGGLIGYRLAGWPGSAVSVLCLIGPGALLVLFGVILVQPELLSGSLAPLQRALGVAVVGLLFGTARRQLAGAKPSDPARRYGPLLTLLVSIAIIAGLPLFAAALVGFVAGALLIREDPDPDRKEGRSS